jgi:hypothetical protein
MSTTLSREILLQHGLADLPFGISEAAARATIFSGTAELLLEDEAVGSDAAPPGAAPTTLTFNGWSAEFHEISGTRRLLLLSACSDEFRLSGHAVCDMFVTDVIALLERRGVEVIRQRHSRRWSEYYCSHGVRIHQSKGDIISFDWSGFNYHAGPRVIDRAVARRLGFASSNNGEA